MTASCEECVWFARAVDEADAEAELAQHMRREHPELVVEWFAARARRKPDFEVFRDTPTRSAG